MSEPLPCPNCGCAVHGWGAAGGGCTIDCANYCGFPGAGGYDEDDTIEVWNERVKAWPVPKESIHEVIDYDS
jgi:hypothetical protein